MDGVHKPSLNLSPLGPYGLSRPFLEPLGPAVSASPSLVPAPFHKGGIMAFAQPLCSSTGTSTKQGAFCTSAL